MTREKVKFTKRLSVRLATLSTVLAMGGGPIAWMQLYPEKDTAKAESAGSTAEESADDALKPIPMPADDKFAELKPTGDTATLNAETDAFQPATSAADADPVALVGFEAPSDNQPIVRGNDEGLSTEDGSNGVNIHFPASPAASSAPKSGGPLVIEPNRSTQFSTPAFDPPAAPGTDGSASFSISSTPETPAAPAADTADDDLAAPAPSFDPPSYYNAQSESSPAASTAETGYPNDLRTPATSAPAPSFDSPQTVAVQNEEPRRLTPLAPAVAGAAVAGSNSGSFGNPAPTASPSERVANVQPLPSVVDTYSSSSPSPGAYSQASAGAQSGATGDGLPGPENLEGEQTPTLSLQKVVPQEIQVGKQTTFELHVRNTGSTAAHDVVVVDRIPKGTQFVNATPQFTEAPGGQLMWQLGTLQPGDETTVSVQLLPMAEGEIGSVAHVVFQGQASASTICTKPQLTVSHTGPQKVMIGETVALEITVSNTGTGAATGVVIEEDVPLGLAHQKGNELEFELGTLRPGETQRLPLTMTADKPGVIENTVLVRGEGNLVAESTIAMEVIAPDLQVELRGPRMRFLDREATYDVFVANPGTAAAREVELVTYLPKGMKFIDAGNKGHYEPQNHAVYWSLEELPANQSGAAKLTLLPIETGPQKLAVEGRAERGLQNRAEKIVQVEGSAELDFTIADESDPIEVGAETTYVITLTNSGSSPANDIQLAVALPPELKPIGGDGPTRVVIEGGRIAIDPLARIAQGETAVYRLKVQALGTGAAAQGIKLATVQVQLMTRETPVPVGKQEVTRIYSDQ